MQLFEIKGIKEKRLNELNKAGIYTPVDLISFFPKKYLDLTALTDIKTCRDGDEVLILAATAEQPKVSYIKRNLNVVKINMSYDGRKVTLTYFNQPYVAKNIVVGKYYYISGKIRTKKGLDIPNATLFPFTGETAPIPVYGRIPALPQSVLVSAIDAVLSSVSLTGYIPPELREKYDLEEINTAYRVVHHPGSVSEIAEARRSVSVEYLNYMLSVYSVIRRTPSAENKRVYRNRKSQLKEFTDSLPFSLTADQQKTVDDIIADFENGRCNRLVQGDVGCGKTIVALIAAYYAILNGYQCVLMAPTEVLATQHYVNAVSYMTGFGVNVVLLSGNLKKSVRDNVLGEISSGRANLIVGTHAVFSDDVKFAKLSLVITDEQQRFGVNQRSAIENKAESVDVIAMTATPIPRTLALTLYGELGVSTIKTLPAGKAKILTRYIPSEKERDMWEYVRKKCDEGEQTYVVCPRIDDTDDDLVSAEGLYKKKKAIFGDEIGLLHGRLKDDGKNAVMSKFAEGKIKVLIATTVIEVGVDVKNATTMIIYGADRFGLSQLHQLRGRVGRGTLDSYCFVLTDNEAPSVKERISYFCSCPDGFELAEYDFDQRGGGDFIGTGQHGKSGDFAISAENIKAAKAISDELIKDESYVRQISGTITDNRFEYFKSITLN